jgi:hypothetical protein
VPTPSSRHCRDALGSWLVPPDDKDVQGLRQGLRDTGYTEGRDVVIEWRSADGNYDQAARLAADLVQRKVDVIVVETTRAAEVVKRLTSTIPIVLSVVADPVGSVWSRVMRTLVEMLPGYPSWRRNPAPSGCTCSRRRSHGLPASQSCGIQPCLGTRMRSRP